VSFLFYYLCFTSLHIENAQSASHCSLITAREVGVLNVQRCKYKENFEKDYMKGLDVIYWINLDRADNRRNNMNKLFEDPVFENIPNIRITATDGKHPDEMYKKLGQYSKQKERSDSEYGCLLSHLDAIHEFSRSDYDNAIIFEDDVTLEFKSYWKKSIGEIINDAPPDWEVIMLYYGLGTPTFIETEYKKHNGETGALSYLINKRGAKKLMDMSYNNNKYNLNDELHISDYYIYNNLNTYVYKYPYFVFSSDNDSFIHQDHVKSIHNPYKQNMIRAYEKDSL